ncbi:uncharacterized protein LOC132202182 [Neocloeon triangulifer]|uniref:uncharacterized protein LOC132202182 n=1 Tax=Neocloeon triangulifer TaxID=2078957 RepID=UPI00286F7E5C|nr:uncharacterized protein LOC132202182 [Neocloeon triangulifer]
MCSSQRKVSFGEDNSKEIKESKVLLSEEVEISGGRLSAFREIRAAFVANSAVIHPGMMFSFSAMALPEMMAEDSVIKISTEQASWIASIASFATPAGCLFGAYIMDRYGRKFALVLLAIPCILGWLSVGTAGLVAPHVSNDFALNIIYCGRMLKGFGTGIVAGASRVYTSEISTPRRRGTLTSLASLGVSTGVLIGYSLGALFYWPVVAILSALVPLTSVILSLVYLPETPTWYLTQKRNQEARVALQAVRDPQYPSKLLDHELDHLGGVLEIDSKSNKLKELLKGSSLKPLAMVVFYFFTYQFSGISVLTFYNVQIVEMTGAKVDTSKMAVGFAILRLFFNVIGCYLLTFCNRRTLTIASGVTSGLAMICLATHNYLHTQGIVISDSLMWNYLPILCIVSFYITYSLGYLLIAWVLTGEIYPAKIRGLLGGITSCFAHSFLFAAVKSFPYLMENVGFHGSFWFYGCTVAFGSIILFIILPETRGRTLLQIESSFKKKRNPTLNLRRLFFHRLKSEYNKMQSETMLDSDHGKYGGHAKFLSKKRNENLRESRSYSAFNEIRAAIVANLAVIHLGLMFSFSAMTLPEMMAEDSEIPITTEQASWIASIASLATPPGCLFGAYIMDHYGRKFALVFLSIPCILGWLSVGAAGLLTSYVSSELALSIIYCGRVLQGFGTGIAAGSARIYTSEISTPRKRGALTSLASLAISIGVLLGYSLGALFYWPVVAILSSLVPLTAVILSLIYLPETPTWYLTNKREIEARVALQAVRDPKCPKAIINEELEHLGGVSDDGRRTSKWSELKKGSSLKPLALVTFYFYTYQFSGISVLTFYNVQIVESTGAQVDTSQTAVSFAVLRLFFNVIGCYLMTICNRRTLTIASGVASGIAMLSLATHNYLHTQGVVTSESMIWQYLPIICIVSFYIAYSLGYLLIPWVLTGELYPAKIRGLLGGITVCFAHSLLFAAVKSFPYLLENLGFYGSFWFYGCNVTIGSIILFIILPETRGRTLLQIESGFKSKRRARN